MGARGSADVREDQGSEAERAKGPDGVGSWERGETCAAALGEERVAELAAWRPVLGRPGDPMDMQA